MKIKILLLSIILTLSGCASTKQEVKYITPEQMVKKNQYHVTQALELQKQGNHKEAMDILIDLSSQDVAEAQAMLAKYYHLGEAGIERNPITAEKLYLSAIDDYPVALYLLAQLYKEEGDLNGYEIYITKATEKEVVIAAELLALELYLAKDKVGLINMSQKLNNSVSYIFENYLIETLISEYKETYDSKELVFWFKKLSMINPFVQYKYGIAYENGLYGINYNGKMAKYWLKKSALSGNYSAQKDLGKIYFREEDYINAYIYFLLYANTNTLESIRFKTLALSKLSQKEINSANIILKNLLAEQARITK